MRVRKIPIVLPYTGTFPRRRHTLYLRIGVVLFLVLFAFLQINILNESNDMTTIDVTNDSTAAILNMVPPVFHKYLRSRPRNGTRTQNGTVSHSVSEMMRASNISEIKSMIAKYNEAQMVLNEETYGPVQNDSVIIVVQVHNRIKYLRHLIVSLAQARDISKALLIFSHDYYDEELNDLVQSIDFCKVLQIFYPFSIQTHPFEFPGADPHDCPRDMKKEEALKVKCNNALYPDLYGHYREPAFTQTKHHWFWKTNTVFDGLDVTRHHSGMVVFLEEDHYVAEDFLTVLSLMQTKAKESCSKCNILSLGTYLKTFNYYTYNNKKLFRKSKQSSQPQWSFQVMPSLYSTYQKAELTPWISSKHNMGMAFNRTTWQEIKKCAIHFCNYDDYNWDWSLQHLSQQCLQQKLYAMVLRGPRVFHIGECGVHHKKNNCESNQVISKVQQVIHIATKAGQLYPKSITLTMSSVIKKTKLRKGNGGWGDKRDHQLCLNMTTNTVRIF